eukprot:2603604-Pyramimonas_sp.AAC.1
MPRLPCPARPGRTETALRDHPLRTSFNAEQMPRLRALRTWTAWRLRSRTKTLRTPSSVENVPRLPCPAG